MNAAEPLRFVCHHPQVRAPQNYVDAEICELCQFCRPDESTAGTAKDRSLAKHDVVADRTWTWAVGVTTAPRKEPTLANCLASLREAGWDDLRLFAEPNSDLPDGENVPNLTLRDQRLGAFPNWYLGLSELVMRNPTADAYFMAQDDTLFAVGLKSYLERTLWPATRVGVVSVYCPSHYSDDREPGFRAIKLGWRVWGAQGYVFPNDAAREFIQSSVAMEHRRCGPADGLRNIDSVVGLWCEHSGLDYYVHVPSLAQHIGATSTLYPQANISGRRSARDYVPNVEKLAGGELFT